MIKKYKKKDFLETFENEDTEFKEEINFKKPEKWLKTICGFSNKTVGTLIFGVSEDKKNCRYWKL